MKTHTICRICSACCPIITTTKNGRLISAVRKSMLPQEKRYLCLKLKAAPDIVYSPNRLQQPLVREKRTNEFKETSWDYALDIIANKLKSLKSKYGAETVGWLRGMAADWGAPWDYVNRLMNVFGSPNTIGNGSVCYVTREFANTLTYGAMTFPDQRNSKCIVVWGKNDKNTAPNAYENLVYARQHGAKLIVIDPIRTKIASKADIWLQIKPGADGLLAMMMMNIIVSEKLYDKDFIENYTIGFNRLKKNLENYIPEKIAKSIWLDPDKVRKAARLYAQTKPACIIDGNGLDMQLNVFQNVRAIAILKALTGNVDIVGGDIIHQPPKLRNIQMKDHLPKDVKPITFNYPLFDEFHPTWSRHVQSCVVDAILDETPYPLRALIVQSGNPAVTMADSNRAIKALEKLDFLVVIDPFMNKTAKMADIILPATTSFEKTQLNRASIRTNLVTLQNQVIECIGNSWPDWKITFELAKKLGMDKEFPWDNAEDAINYQLEPSGITVEKLRENPKGILIKKTEYKKYKINGFATLTGKVEIYSKTLEQHKYSPVPSFGEYGENFISFYNKKDEFPLVGINGARSGNFTHTQFRNIPCLLKGEPECFVDIHPYDAKIKGIKTGDKVMVTTPKGFIIMKAAISDVVYQGSIRIAWGWGGVDFDYSLNNLTDDKKRDKVTGTPSSRNFMCNIEKLQVKIRKKKVSV